MVGTASLAFYRAPVTRTPSLRCGPAAYASPEKPALGRVAGCQRKKRLYFLLRRSGWFCLWPSVALRLHRSIRFAPGRGISAPSAGMPPRTQAAAPVPHAGRRFQDEHLDGTVEVGHAESQRLFYRLPNTRATPFSTTSRAGDPTAEGSPSI